MRLAVLLLTSLIIVAPGQLTAATCNIPGGDIDVSYDVYHESNTAPDTNQPLADVIKVHFQKAELIFGNNGLALKFTNGGLPNPVQLSKQQADLAKELLDDVVGENAEEAIENFKNASRAQGTYQDDLLNVYYIDVEHLSGMHLRSREGYSHNIILIGQGFKDDTLTHEIGHAMSLSHVNFWTHDDPEADAFPNGVQVEYCVEHGYWNNECDFSSDNVMWAASDSRNIFTDGQLTRVACNETSALIANQDYDPAGNGESTISCPDWSNESPDCPALY